MDSRGYQGDSVANSESAGLNGNYQYTADPEETATWSLGGLQPGKPYEVFATWVPGPDRTDDATYSVTGATAMDDGATTIGVDQRLTCPA